ncbi:MAG: hypothetical protein J7K13_03550 [Thermoplasmata archaeon]|nr:hypothetical protein [Thermoplasmata archaeon]
MNERSIKAQMLVYEAIVCAVLLAVAVFFVYQMQPPTIQSTTYSNRLKILGDDALRSLDSYPSDRYNGYSLLEEYIIDNNTANFTEFLNLTLPQIVAQMGSYNIYISNGTLSVLWIGSNSEKFGLITRSHRLVAISSDELQQNPYLYQHFQGYNGCVYDVILEMWQI